MLWAYSNYICYSSLLLSGLCFFFAGYAYRVNARRPADDPDKRDAHWGAFFLATITWPILLIILITITILRAIAYSISLFLVLAALIFIRKPFLLIWLDKIATKIGNKLLEVNTFLIKAFLGRPIKSPKS